MGFVIQLVLFCSCLHFSTTEIHSLQYFYTATSGISNFPEFISVGKVDGVDISYYDSIIQRSVPRQMWMEQLDQQYWDSESSVSKMYDQIFRLGIVTVGQRFNQTGGVYVFQKAYGCHWDDDTGATHGYEVLGYDGENFLKLDLKTMKWKAKVAHALPTKLKWDNTEHFINRRVYFEETCIEWLKKYVHYGTSTLGRKVPPEVTLLRMNSSSPVVCHATGFYPEAVNITLKRDGEEMQEGVVVRETLSNHDGTFQKRAVLPVSPEELKNSIFTCEVAHISGETSITLKKMDSYNSSNSLGIIIGCVIAALVVTGVIVIVGFVMMTKKAYKKAEHTDSSFSTMTSDTDTDKKEEDSTVIVIPVPVQSQVPVPVQFQDNSKEDSTSTKILSLIPDSSTTSDTERVRRKITPRSSGEPKDIGTLSYYPSAPADVRPGFI
ncbi:class I histocompatibility antigen, F10 alpha chain-like [Alosa pseudoharengus]|uniref:class I histocompatibility antigen, F10 alpha chain-like n=1 Tax=Alosa pseudoharengus TaxID=34774 RepID=UPI003F8A723F